MGVYIEQCINTLAVLICVDGSLLGATLETALHVVTLPAGNALEVKVARARAVHTNRYVGLERALDRIGPAKRCRSRPGTWNAVPEMTSLKILCIGASSAPRC